MFGDNAIKLLVELNQSIDNIPPFNVHVFGTVLEEMKLLYDANRDHVEHATRTRDSDSDVTLVDTSFHHSVHFRHTALTRNKRCLLAYLYNRMRRLRQMRWEFGSFLPPEVSSNLILPENQWFKNYSKSLAVYMKSIGENGLNLTMDTLPPKSLHIEVRCLVDYGKYEFEDGQVVVLKKNTHHLLPRAYCEPLIRLGVLEHINF
ncbi:DNA replication complex GINS protein PSF1 isoform X2 [Orussus abietinus]|nr:DNA replication complex GINS protein PSF1 isoform X2 [Orussus abietinus]